MNRGSRSRCTTWGPTSQLLPWPSLRVVSQSEIRVVPGPLPTGNISSMASPPPPPRTLLFFAACDPPTTALLRVRPNALLLYGYAVNWSQHRQTSILPPPTAAGGGPTTSDGITERGAVPTGIRLRFQITWPALPLADCPG